MFKTHRGHPPEDHDSSNIKLTALEKNVLEFHKGGMTLTAIAKELGVTRQYISQTVKTVEAKKSKFAEKMDTLKLSEAAKDFLSRNKIDDMPINDFLKNTKYEDLKKAEGFSIFYGIELVSAFNGTKYQKEAQHFKSLIQQIAASIEAPEDH